MWSIDSCQNRVSADQYHLTVPRAQVSTHRGRVFFEVIRWQLPVLNNRRLRFIFSSDSYEMCLGHYGPALLGFWLQTDLGRENSASFWKYRRGRPFLTMVTCWSRSTSNFYAQGPVARSMVSANRWLRGIKRYRFPWYLTLVSTKHASSNPGQAEKTFSYHGHVLVTLHVQCLSSDWLKFDRWVHA